MTDYSYYVPMPLERGLRLCNLEAQHAALQQVSRQIHAEILTTALTDSERIAMCAILDTALKRTSAGIAEFDGYKRSEPIATEGECVL